MTNNAFSNSTDLQKHVEQDTNSLNKQFKSTEVQLVKIATGITFYHNPYILHFHGNLLTIKMLLQLP